MIKRLKYLCFAIFAFSTFLFVLSASNLSKLDEFLADANVWKADAQSIVERRSSEGVFLRWLSEDKAAARYPGYSNSPRMNFLGENVIEAVFRFRDGKLAKVEVSLYNRGDLGDISIEALDKKVSEVSEKISKWSSDKGVMLDRQRLNTGMWISKKAWVRGNQVAIEMFWSSTNYQKTERAEYLKLEFQTFNPKDDPRKKTTNPERKVSELKATVSSMVLKKNIKKDENAYVYIIGLPMVDQGQKGYCAVASAETILRYYGSEVDQHLVAQIAGTDPDIGTDPEKMYEMLKKTGMEFGIRIKEIIGFSGSSLKDLLHAYNRVEKKRKIAITKFSNWMNLGAYYNQMNIEILKEARVKEQKSEYAKFQKEIISSIDEGVPLLWGVMLGMVKENVELPQTLGGHMRIIKGYNKEKNEIVYSDTWGVKHEWKTMSMEDAWAVTTGLYVMEPRKN